jgi:16S rRNA (cytosine967-C5)-methyltransferase
MTRQSQGLTPRSAALQVLLEVEQNHAFSNLELKSTLAKENFERRDAALATELVYGTLSRLNTLDWFAAQLLDKPIHRLETWVRSLLRMSLYQLHYLDRIPARAVVHEAVEEAKLRGHKGTVALINGVLREYLRKKEKLEIPNQWPKFKKIAITHSHPEWLVKRWLRVYGERETIQMCAQNNHPPKLSIRVNRLKSTLEDLLTWVQQESNDVEISRSQVSSDGLLVSHLGNIALTEAFQKGFCTVQDESSMLVCHAVAPESGTRILDTCAAPGGKTTHIAERMGNRGKILALDIHPHKLKLIQENAARLGISVIETKTADATALPVNLAEEPFDRVLVDAPCSGFGVIRRKPDLKWQKKEDDIFSIAKTQLHILEEASKWVAPAGKLIYSTCTVDPEENHKLVYQFLAGHPEFILDTSFAEDMPDSIKPYVHKSGGYVQILPHYFGSDGFFISRLVRI